MIPPKMVPTAFVSRGIMMTRIAGMRSFGIGDEHYRLMTGYVKVARLKELAEGEGRTVEAAGRWIAVFRTAHGVFAVDNACPHMAGPLGAGRLDGFVVTCPLHGWRIDVRTGR